MGSTSTSSCVASTRLPAAAALIDYAVRRRDVVFWAYDYLDYLPRLVSTRKLVEDGSLDINN
jgi:hypothetical protein